MPTSVHPPSDWPALCRAGRAAASTLAGLAHQVRPGVSLQELDAWVRADTARRGGTPSQLGYQGFPASVCTSVNDVVCHGIPDGRLLIEGDIVNCDVTTELGGWHGDTSRTFCVGRVGPEATRLVAVAREALEEGIRAVHPGARLGVVGAAIERFVEAMGYTVVTAFGGHGIGRHMHLSPHVHHVGPADRGPIMVPGLCFTIEPMVNQGLAEVSADADGWTVRTADGGLSAQFEHTVLVTGGGVEVLTLPL